MVNSTRPQAAYAFLTLLLITLLTYLSIAQLQPPAVVPESAPLDQFSSARAMKHLRAIAQKPHPTGTRENARVRDYIVNELKALGVAVEVQPVTVVIEPAAGQEYARPIATGTLHNIVARLPGSANTRALMLAAHYDSVPAGPGATDDGAGVVALLETLRALKATPQVLRNDLILLFTDGEELGLMGARGFVDEHPWAKDAGLVLNFEGRGAGGSVFMFETSQHNGWLVREVAHAAPHAVANSLMYALYKELPNDTDLTVFKQAGLAGLNFAYADRLHHYHTALDTPEQIDERSVQHHGSYALALTRHFGNLNLREVSAPDRVFFNALGSTIIHYPQSWVGPLSLFITALFIALVAYGWKRKRLSARGLSAGFVAWLLSAVVVAVTVMFLSWMIKKLHHGYQFLPNRDPYEGGFYKLALVLLTVAIVAGLYTWWRRKISAANLTAGALIWWCLLLWASTMVLPAASYLLAYPLLFSLIGLAVLLLAQDDEGIVSWTQLAILLLCAAPGIILVAPVIEMLFVMLSLGLPEWLMVLLVLLLGALAPQLELCSWWRRWWWPAPLALAGVGLIIFGLLTAGFDAERRKVNSLFYAFNTDTGKAFWSTLDAATDEWTSRFIPTGSRPESITWLYPWISQTVWQSEAPVLTTLVAPQLEALEDKISSDQDLVRTLRLRITSPRQAALMLVFTQPGIEIRSATVNGKRIAGRAAVTPAAPPGANSAETSLRFFYAAPPREGFELAMQVRAGPTLKLTVADLTYELPQLPGQTYPARPEYMMPASRFGTSDATVVSKTFNIETLP